jgi:4-alpha-glucanotransferase
MPFPRSSGILLHPTSFPSRFGVGDLGLEAYRFIDFLKDTHQQYWQVYPWAPLDTVIPPICATRQWQEIPC